MRSGKLLRRLARWCQSCTTVTTRKGTPCTHYSSCEPAARNLACADRHLRLGWLQGGKTTLTNTVLHASKEVRDAVLKSPMKSGVAKSDDKLAALLA